LNRGLIIAGAVVLVAIIVFFSVRGGGDGGEKVYVEPVTPRKIESVVTAPSEINPKVKVNISAYVIGKIEKLYFQEGDTVHKGEKLVDLERTAFVAARDRMKSAVSNSRIEVDRSKTALATAELEYKRAVAMQQQGIQAQELFDKARLDYENAQAGYASAQQQVVQAQAGLAQAETDLSHTELYSPIDGKVVQLNAHEGEVVITGTMNNPGSVIATLADMSEILAEAQVGETEVTSIRIGQPAEVHVDAVADKVYRGHVSEIGSSATAKSAVGSGVRYFLVKVQIENPDDRLRPGMTSQVSITTSTLTNVPSVPIQSVVERTSATAPPDEDDTGAPKKKFVLVVSNNKIHLTEVRTGISDATHVAILSGVKAGDPVVTGPFRTLKKLKEGDAVEITKETKTSTGGT
jgi:HlyD family secretion protein